MQRLEHLGHIISQDGIQPNPVKVAAVQGIQPPTTIKDLQRFLGLTGWFRRFIKDYASIAAPLYELTKKKTAFTWSDTCQSAFDELKQRLMTEPLLIFPRLDEPFVIQCDASDKQIGAVLLQARDGTLRPVQYLSHSLDTSQQNYGITEKECFSMYYAIQMFQKYVRGQKFIVESDHSCLQWLHKHANQNRRLMRWSLNLSDYNFVVVYRKGNTNVIADALSRLAILQDRAALPINSDNEWIGEDGIPVVMTIQTLPRRPLYGPPDCGLIGTMVEVPATWFGVEWARSTNPKAIYRMMITGFKKGLKPPRDRWIATYTDPHLHTVDHYDMRYEAVQFYKCERTTPDLMNKPRSASRDGRDCVNSIDRTNSKDGIGSTNDFDFGNDPCDRMNPAASTNDFDFGNDPCDRMNPAASTNVFWKDSYDRKDSRTELTAPGSSAISSSHSANIGDAQWTQTTAPTCTDGTEATCARGFQAREDVDIAMFSDTDPGISQEYLSATLVTAPFVCNDSGPLSLVGWASYYECFGIWN